MAKKAAKRTSAGRKASQRRKADEAKEAVTEAKEAEGLAKVKAAFLDALRSNYGLVVRAAELVGVRPKTLYSWRIGDTEFAKEWEAAVEQSTDMLEAEAVRRAAEGYPGRPVVHQGSVVVEITEYSDQLLSLMLKSRRAKFADLKRVAGADGESPVQIEKIERVIVDPEGDES
jgi:hypothetical protein